MFILTLLAGFLLSLTAAYYSIIGLLAIFPGAVIPISLMGGSLEFAKLVAASWLYRSWSFAPKLIKAYFIFAILILVLITSLGTFGYLSKVHLETQSNTTDNTVEISRLQNEIISEKQQMQNAQTSITILNNLVEKTDIKDAVRVRSRQKTERAELTDIVKSSSKIINDLNVKLAPLQKENLKVEAEVGPLKYIAELIYGETAKDHFNSAVRFVIILIVLVFDPLAVLLLIAANITYVNRTTTPSLEKPIKVVEKVAKDKEISYNKRIKDSIYNFMMKKDDFGITHANKVE